MNPDFLKYAYELGVEKAITDAGLTKEAWVWPALKGVGKGIWNVLQPAGRAATSVISKPVAGAGRRIGKHLTPYLSPGTKRWVGAATTGLPKEMGMWGLLSGGAGGLMAPEGERLEGALRGLGTGLTMGAGWGAAKGLTRHALARGMRSAVGPKGVAAIGRRMKTPLLKPSTEGLKGVPLAKAQRGVALREAATKLGPGEWAKTLGTKALLGGVPFGVGWTASGYMPSFEKHPWATVGAGGLGQAMTKGPVRQLPASLLRRLPSLGFEPQRRMVY